MNSLLQNISFFYDFVPASLFLFYFRLFESEKKLLIICAVIKQNESEVVQVGSDMLLVSDYFYTANIVNRI